MADVVEQAAEKVMTRFVVELADWVHEHVASHPLTRENRVAPAAAASSPPAPGTTISPT